MHSHDRWRLLEWLSLRQTMDRLCVVLTIQDITLVIITYCVQLLHNVSNYALHCDHTSRKPSIQISIHWSLFHTGYPDTMLNMFAPFYYVLLIWQERA
jgi:hypothetical protein